ncbi:MAG: hypothetical protein RLZZ380_1127 [Actinomycetota bacterium]|jgi:hypothetical protein
MNLVSALKATALFLAVTISATGCATAGASRVNAEALTGIKNNPMPGFELASTDEGDSICLPASYCTTNARLFLKNTKTFESRADFCKELLAWAPSVGADSWMYDPDYIALPIKDHEGAAQFACLGANNYSLIGSTGNVRWTMAGDGTQLSVETIMGTDGSLEDERMTLKTWDEAKSQLYAGTRLNMDILSSLETFRLENPKKDPSKLATVKTALKDLNLPEEAEFVLDKSGSAHYLYLPSDGFMLERCLNIKPFSETFFQMPNPGSGFVGLFILDGQPKTDEFGYLESAKCPGQE